MTISQSTQELLRAHAGRGFSDDPALTARHKIRLLQNTSKLPKHGRGAPGLFLLPDEAQTCTSKLRVILGAVYSTYVERMPDGKPVGREHFVLPADAAKDGFGWLLSNGNMLETEARLAGLFNNAEAELDLNRTGMRVARALNSDAKARANKHGVPIFGLAYEFASTELSNDRGQPYHGVVFQFHRSGWRGRRGPVRRRSSGRPPCAISLRPPSLRRSGRPRTGEALLRQAQSFRPATLGRGRLSPAATLRSKSLKRCRRSNATTARTTATFHSEK